MCCSTGVCGPEVNERLVHFAADLDWLKAQGASVRRINLSREPMEFVTHPAVKALMDASGGDDLPAIMVGSKIVSQGRYPSRAELSEIAEIGSARGIDRDHGNNDFVMLWWRNRGHRYQGRDCRRPLRKRPD